MPLESDPNPSVKHLEVLRYIVAHVETHGFQPSQQEIADFLGISKSATAQRLRELERRGVVRLSAKNRERAVILNWVQFTAFTANTEKPAPGTLDERYNRNFGSGFYTPDPDK